MKKALSILLAVALVCALFAFAGCGGKDDGGKADVSGQADVTTLPGADAATKAGGDQAAAPKGALTWSDDTIDVKTYVNSNNYGTEGYIVITNKTDKDVSLSLSAKPKDASGAAVGDEDCWIGGVLVGAGRTTMRMMDLSIEETIDVASIDYEPEYGNSLYKDATADLDVKTSPLEDDEIGGLTVEITNNGAEAAQDVNAYAVFFGADGSAVNATSALIGAIEPGAAGTGTLYCSVEYATFEVYTSGSCNAS